MFPCKICNRECHTFIALCRHTTMAHNMKILDYYIEYENLKVPKCEICNKDARIRSGITFSSTCSRKCYLESLKGRTHSEETKKTLSEKRKAYLKDHKEEHNWSKYHGEETEPEKIFRELISTIENVSFYQWYMPLECERNYEIDFAIPDKKIAFEINGNQHYDENGNLTPYYLERHNYLESFGWKILEIPHFLCYNEEKLRTIILQTLDGQIKFSQSTCNEVVNYRIFKKKAKKTLIFQQKVAKEIEQAQKEFNDMFKIIDMICKYGDKNGIVGILSGEFKTSNTHIRRLLNRYGIEVKKRKSPSR